MLRDFGPESIAVISTCGYRGRWNALFLFCIVLRSVFFLYNVKGQLDLIVVSSRQSPGSGCIEQTWPGTSLVALGREGFAPRLSQS